MTTYPLIQITDSSGQVTGTATMAEAFEKELIRNTVYVVLRDGQGRYLLQERSANVPNYPLYWDMSAGGHIDEDETPQTAAYRELEEELGVIDSKLDYWRSLYFESEGDGRTYKYFAHVYTGKHYDLGNLEVARLEVTSTRYFTADEVDSLTKVTPLTKHILSQL